MIRWGKPAKIRGATPSFSSAPKYPVAVERTCTYLSWRYRIGGRDGARLIVVQGDGTPRGFALIEKVRGRVADVHENLLKGIMSKKK